MAKANNQNPPATETEEEKNVRLESEQKERNRLDEEDRERERLASEQKAKTPTAKLDAAQVIDPNAPIKVNLNPGRTRRIKPVYVGPERDEEGRLTRKGMQEVLQTGVIVRQGDIINHPDDMPSDEELVHGDEKAKAKLRETLILQKKALDDTIARLT